MRYRSGHVLHPIQLRLVCESPWQWRDGLVADVDDRALRVEYVAEEGSVWLWHHVHLGLTRGDPVRVHERLHGLFTPDGIACVDVHGGLGPRPDPEHPDLWRAEVPPAILDLSTGRGLPPGRV
jgi:hypothetical protein